MQCALANYAYIVPKQANCVIDLVHSDSEHVLGTMAINKTANTSIVTVLIHQSPTNYNETKGMQTCSCTKSHTKSIYSSLLADPDNFPQLPQNPL